MKRFLLCALLLLPFTFATTLAGQCHGCDDPGCDPDATNCGPGGGDPGPAINPNPGSSGHLNWVNQGNPNYGVYVGGTIDREQVGAAINRVDGKMYVAVASRTNDDGAGNHAVTLYTNTTGGNDLTLVGNIAWNYGAPGAAGTQAYSSVNPKLVLWNEGQRATNQSGST